MKFKLFLSLLFILGIFHLSTAFSFKQDTVPFQNPEYKGYRLAMTQIALSPIKDNWLKIKFTAINTGREDLLLGKEMAPPPSLVVNIDEAFGHLNLAKYQDQIKAALLKSDLTIRAGQHIPNNALKIEINKALRSPKEGDPSIAETQNERDDLQAKEPKETYDSDGCSDLVIESVTMTKKSKKSVTLKYTITNKGAGPAYLRNESGAGQSDLAIKAHMASSEKLTRGALPLGGTYISQNQQLLKPGESLTDEIRLDIRSMTRFTPVIILELDPYLIITECDETNNLNFIKVD